MKEITGFLQFVAEGNEAKAKEHFEAAMAEKVSKTLDARKVAVAHKHFNEETLEERNKHSRYDTDTGKRLEIYAKKNGGIDKADMLAVAKMLQKGDESGALKYASTMDTDPRDYILSIIYSNLDEAAKSLVRVLLIRMGREDLEGIPKW